MHDLPLVILSDPHLRHFQLPQHPAFQFTSTDQSSDTVFHTYAPKPTIEPCEVCNGGNGMLTGHSSTTERRQGNVDSQTRSRL
jgi:hypothetical protein